MSRLTREEGRTRLAIPDSQKQTGPGKIFTLRVQLTTSRIGNLTRSIHTLLYVMTIHTTLCDDHTCIHKYLSVRHHLIVLETQLSLERTGLRSLHHFKDCVRRLLNLKLDKTWRDRFLGFDEDLHCFSATGVPGSFF